tara:strand:+ start:2613 stop:3194 length:582 start_codon:yes stop_codon:yes gene_type:complete
MILLVGLGNPGPQYAVNRHNVGFMCIDAIADDYNFSDFKSKFQGFAAEGEINGTKVIALKPQTFMNLSGQSIQAAASFYKILPENIVVIHDELDIEPPRIKTKIGGGHGGHNGIKDTEKHLGKEFWRIRIGIGRPNHPNVSSYVLSNFSPSDIDWVGAVIDSISHFFPLFIKGKPEEFNTRVAEDLKTVKIKG